MAPWRIHIRFLQDYILRFFTVLQVVEGLRVLATLEVLGLRIFAVLQVMEAHCLTTEHCLPGTECLPSAQ